MLVEVKRIILASASPRRHELLTAAGIDHLVRVKPIEEVRKAGEDPGTFVQRLALEKARAAAESSDEIVLGADTVVVVDGQVFGKPVDDEDARRSLRTLSGRDHVVLTGIALVFGQTSVVDISATRVQFVSLSEDDIETYVKSGEPAGKAGAYAIQGLASRFVRRIEGCYQNVVGLPVSLVYHHLKVLEGRKDKSG